MRRTRLIFILFVLNFMSCGDDYQSSIPDVKVSFTCSLLQNPYYKIKTPGQFIPVQRDNHYLPLGYGGLIIGQSVFATYFAYDAACPVEAQKNIVVEVKDDGLGTAICPKCGTEYDLSQGGFPKGKGTEYLKHYKVSVVGDVLKVAN